MKPNWVDYGTIASGIAFMFLHFAGCLRSRRTPSLPVAVTALTTGGGVFLGAVLILTPFVESLQQMPMRVEYSVIAGVAVLWTSVQYGWCLWAGHVVMRPERPGAAGGAVRTTTDQERRQFPPAAASAVSAEQPPPPTGPTPSG